MYAMFAGCNVPEMWWYIEDNGKRRKVIKNRANVIGLKEKIENKMEGRNEVDKKIHKLKI